MEEVEILVATSAGVCFGVERAVNLSEKVLSEERGPISSLGPLIHNPQAIDELAQKGLKVADSVEQVQGTIVFRSHGVTVQVEREAVKKGLKIVDATCPLVKVPQNFAKRLSEKGYFVIIVGDKSHPEIKGVRSYVEGENVAIVEKPEDIDQIPIVEKVGVISQTTLKKKVFLDVVEKCQLRFKEVKVHNTICGATKDRQEAALELAKNVECVVVIGGRNSSNTQKLYDICRENASSAHLIETENEIKLEWFKGLKRIGITAGASTPQIAIERAKKTIQDMTAKTL